MATPGELLPVMNKTPDLVPPSPGGTETEAALQRILQSERFRKNASLRLLLEYLVTRSLKGQQNQIKETTVAMDVFGRPKDFDSRIDNIVRVQAHRLRKLLTSYYEAEGAGERTRFSIPRGGYIPHIERIPEANSEEAPVEAVNEADAPPDLPPVLPAPAIDTPRLVQNGETGSRLRPYSRVPLPLLVGLAFALGLLVCFLTLASLRMVVKPDQLALERVDNAETGALAQVWGPLLKPGMDCVVSYSNPVFLWAGGQQGPRILVPYNGPVSVPPGAQINVSPADLKLSEGVAGKNPAFFFSDGWTGVGEVAAMQRITALLSPRVRLQVVRSRALTFADIKGSNVIFLGSPWANEMQDKINVGATPLVSDNEGNILNLKPKASEPDRFRAELDPATHQILSTYGLFSVLPGVSAGTKVYISAGVNTYGTEGAIDFMTASAGAEEVIRRLGTAEHQTLPEYFQVVVKSEMIKGEPAEARLVLARAVEQSSPSTVP